MKRKHLEFDTTADLAQCYLEQVELFAASLPIRADRQRYAFWAEKPGFADQIWIEVLINDCPGFNERHTARSFWPRQHYRHLDQCEQQLDVLGWNIVDQLVALYQIARFFGLIHRRCRKLDSQLTRESSRINITAGKYLTAEDPTLDAFQRATLDLCEDVAAISRQQAHAICSELHDLAMLLLMIAYGDRMHIAHDLPEAFLRPTRPSSLTGIANLRACLMPCRTLQSGSIMDKAYGIVAKHGGDLCALICQGTEHYDAWLSAIRAVDGAIDDSF